MINPNDNKLQVSTVAVSKAPLMKFFAKHMPTDAIMDTGAESNVISDIRVKRLNLTIMPTRSGANQIDRTQLKVLGSVNIDLKNKEDSFTYEALVCKDIGDIMLCGNPFMEQGIIPNPVDKCIEIRSQYSLPRFVPWRSDSQETLNLVGNTFLLRSSDQMTIYPGELYEMDAPQELSGLGDCEVLLTPRSARNSKTSFVFQDEHQCEIQQFPPPALTSIIGGKIRIENPSLLPVNIPKNEHLADIKLVTVCSVQGQATISHVKQNVKPLYPRPKPTVPTCQLDRVIVDPDNILSESQK